GLEPIPHEPPLAARLQSRFAQYRERLTGRFGRAQRLALIESMWQAAFSDGAIDAQEDRLMQRAGDLLGLSPAEVAEVRRRSRAGAEHPARCPSWSNASTRSSRSSRSATTSHSRQETARTQSRRMLVTYAG